ncbi:MAG: hypothetical protein ACI9SC_000242 [Gammaproteobacteria bacterium]|jgi:hypothetical protein
MAKIIFNSAQLRFTNEVQQVELAVKSYRELLKELVNLYPGMSPDDLGNYMIMIDGLIIQTPFLEKLDPESELIFIRKIAAG